MAEANSNEVTLIKVGPAGSLNDNDTKWEQKLPSKISRIFISFGEDDSSSYITSLQFQYIEDKKLKLSPIYGRHVGLKFEMVVFSNPIEDSFYEDIDGMEVRAGASEYIIGLSGTVTSRVTSLTFETNQKKYGPFGSVPQGAKNFSFRFGPGYQLAALYGSFTSTCLSSVGVYLHPDFIE